MGGLPGHPIVDGTVKFSIAPIAKARHVDQQLAARPGPVKQVDLIAPRPPAFEVQLKDVLPSGGTVALLQIMDAHEVLAILEKDFAQFDPKFGRFLNIHRLK